MTPVEEIREAIRLMWKHGQPWPPEVALAIVDWLEAEAATAETMAEDVVEQAFGHALAVARAQISGTETR